MCAHEQCGLIEWRIPYGNTSTAISLIRSDPCIPVLASIREAICASASALSTPLLEMYFEGSFTSDFHSTFPTREDLTQHPRPEISSGIIRQQLADVRRKVPQAANSHHFWSLEGFSRGRSIPSTPAAVLASSTCSVSLFCLAHESSKVSRVFQELTDKSRRRCLLLFKRQSSKHHRSHGFACTCPLLLWVCFFSQPFLCQE